MNQNDKNWISPDLIFINVWQEPNSRRGGYYSLYFTSKVFVRLEFIETKRKDYNAHHQNECY